MTDKSPEVEVEVPGYDTCQPCETLGRCSTTIGQGYACPVCQMTYIQVDKGAYIPFDQAAKLYAEKVRRAERRKKMANRQQLVGKPRKKKRKR